jgi:hypothetical protein
MIKNILLSLAILILFVTLIESQHSHDPVANLRTRLEVQLQTAESRGEKAAAEVIRKKISSLNEQFEKSGDKLGKRNGVPKTQGEMENLRKEFLEKRNSRRDEL